MQCPTYDATSISILPALAKFGLQPARTLLCTGVLRVKDVLTPVYQWAVSGGHSNLERSYTGG